MDSKQIKELNAALRLWCVKRENILKQIGDDKIILELNAKEIKQVFYDDKDSLTCVEPDKQ